MKRFSKLFLAVIGTIVILAGGFLFWLSNQYIVPVMMYHNVEDANYSEANWVSPEKFEYQMQYLKEHGYRVIPLSELVEGMKAGRKFSRKTVAITFDDGYQNNYDYAYPVLKKYQFPAVIFIISGHIGDERLMTWEELKEMERNGITIGGHTRHHAYLPSSPVQVMHDEIETGKKIVEGQLGHPIFYFAYPSGGFTDLVKAVVKEAGYQAACTTNRGYDTKDPYELKRIRFSNADKADIILWFKLSGYYNIFREPKNPY